MKLRRHKCIEYKDLKQCRLLSTSRPDRRLLIDAEEVIMKKKVQFAAFGVLFLLTNFGCVATADEDTTRYRAPRITEHPLHTTVARHEPTTLNCGAHGEPPPTIEWYKEGELITNAGGQHRIVLPNGSLFFYEVRHSRKETDAGVYWCVAKNKVGEARSNNATLEIAILKEDFRIEPKDRRAVLGETTLLECEPPRGHPEPTILWKKNGQIIDLDNSNRLRLVDGANLAIQEVKRGDEGRYQCVAKNIVGIRETPPALLTISVKPYIIRGPQDIVAMSGSTVTLECQIGGDPVPEVIWSRGSNNKMPSKAKVLEGRGLRLEHVGMQDEGEYICEAVNAVGTTSSMATLTVHSLPIILQKPKDTKAEMYKNAVFTCDGEGSPKPFIFWSIEGNKTVIFPGETIGHYKATVAENGQDILVVQNATLDLHNIVVVCCLVNIVGSDAWRARLHVKLIDDNIPPIISYGPTNQTLPLKSIATFQCKSASVPVPVIHWYKDGEPLYSNPRMSLSEQGTLQIKDLQKEDSGVYTCSAVSEHGKAIWNATLRAESPTNPNIGFFRSPDPSAFPGPPTRPLVVNRTRTSITLSWSRNNKIGSSSLIGYQIEMFSKSMRHGSQKNSSDEEWKTIARRVLSPVLVVEDLKPTIAYMFVIRAENSHGLSAPSAPSEATCVLPENEHFEKPYSENKELKEARNNLLAGQIVELVDIQAVNSTSIKLTWEILNSEFVEGFYIYSRGLDGHARSTSMLTVLHAKETSGFHVSGLHPNTKYNFFLIPFYKTVDGKPSNSRSVQTLEDVPSEPPQYMEAALLNISSVYLKWNPPPPASQNGIIRSYQVIIRGGTNETVLSNISVNAATPFLLLTNLTALTSYSVIVAAATKMGLGPYTAPAYLRLDPTTKLLFGRPDERNVLLENGNVNIPNREYPLSEPWMVVLMICMVSLIVVLFAAILIIRRKQLLAQKSSFCDSHCSGGILDTPLSLKGAAGLRHPITTSLITNENSKDDHSFWIDNSKSQSSSSESSSWRHSDCKEKECYPQLADYAEVAVQLVKPLSTFQNDKHEEPLSPAPYATTTLLVPRNSIQECERNEDGYTSSHYYDGGCYSETYFFPEQRGSRNGSVQGVPSRMVFNNTRSNRKIPSEPRQRRFNNSPVLPANPPPAYTLWRHNNNNNRNKFYGNRNRKNVTRANNGHIYSRCSDSEYQEAYQPGRQPKKSSTTQQKALLRIYPQYLNHEWSERPKPEEVDSATEENHLCDGTSTSGSSSSHSSCSQCQKANRDNNTENESHLRILQNGNQT